MLDVFRCLLKEEMPVVGRIVGGKRKEVNILVVVILRNFLTKSDTPSNV